MRLGQVSCACPRTSVLRDEPRRARPVAVSATGGRSGDGDRRIGEVGMTSRTTSAYWRGCQQTAINLLGSSRDSQFALWRQYIAPRHQKLPLRRRQSHPQNRLAAAVAATVSAPLAPAPSTSALLSRDTAHTRATRNLFFQNNAQPLRNHHAPWPPKATMIKTSSPAQ